MNTAEQIKSFYQNDTNAIIEESELKSISVDQDCDLKTTTFVFPDNSVLVVNNSDVYTYGSLKIKVLDEIEAIIKEIDEIIAMENAQ